MEPFAFHAGLYDVRTPVRDALAAASGVKCGGAGAGRGIESP